jgi:UDPglucose--hexose-1-phosphate uridylyltransferase
MSELRWNPLLEEWVITATHRQDRTFLPPRKHCPLCPTRPGGPSTEIERETFEIVVFENRFPSLHRDPPPPAVEGTALVPVRPAAGACEVVVYTPEHDTSLGQLAASHVEHLITAWAHRTRELAARPEVDYVFVFENRGEAIGVTLHHPHGQIYAYPFVPPLVGREVAAAARHHEAHGTCLWCKLADQEDADGRRVLLDEGGWLATVPMAARWPYEVHLQPRRHVGWLPDLDPGEVRGLATTLGRLLRGYDRLFGFPLPYVMAIHQRPSDGLPHPGYHLHLEFYPPHRSAQRLKYLAGSEAGAGAFINDTMPEGTAAQLREAIGT